MHFRERSAFTLIELLVVIAIIAILAVVVVLTLNPAQLLAQSRDANRISDIATLQSALNLYTTDQSANLQLGSTASTSISVPDPNASTTCGSLGLPSLGTGQGWSCSSSSNYRLATSTGWIGINFNLVSSGAPFGSLPVDPVNQTSSGLFYSYNTNGSQFEAAAILESAKYKSQYGNNPSTSLFPEVISGGTPTVSALYSPTGLVGYWPMTEGSGTTIFDNSGNGNNGTWSGSSIAYSSGKVGSSALSYDGTVSNVVAISPLTSYNPSQISMTVWAMEAGAGAGAIEIGTIQPCCANGYGISLDAQSGSTYYVDWNIDSGSVRNEIGSGSVFSFGTWNFFAGTFDGATMRLYVNGQLYGSPASATIAFASHPFDIGRTSAASFPWKTSDLRLYSRALSPAEILAIYNAEK